MEGFGFEVGGHTNSSKNTVHFLFVVAMFPESGDRFLGTCDLFLVGIESVLGVVAKPRRG